MKYKYYHDTQAKFTSFSPEYLGEGIVESLVAKNIIPNKFTTFLDSFKKYDSSLVESIKEGFGLCFESQLISDPYTELHNIANNIANKIKCAQFGNCVHFAELFVLAVYKHNPKLLKSFVVIEGYVNTPIGDGIPQQHTWIMLNNGDEIDPTFLQFGGNSHKLSNRQRKFTGTKYYETTANGTWFSEKRNRFPDMIWKSVSDRS